MNVPNTDIVSPGDPLSIRAATWNNLLEQAGLVEGSRAIQSAGTPSAWGHPCSVVVIKNTTVSDLTAGSIVTPGTAASIGTFPDNPHETRRRPYLSCGAPTLPIQPVCVLIDPVGAGKYGRACVMGVTVCTVNVTSSYHKFAAAYAGTDKLLSASIGPARILHKVSSTGEQLCVVLLTNVVEGLVKDVRCTSNTVTDSRQPGVVVEPDGDGTASDGATVKMSKSDGDQFRSGGTYPLYLNGWDGTTEIYTGLASTSWERPVCRASVEVTDRAWFYGHFENEEDV